MAPRWLTCDASASDHTARRDRMQLIKSAFPDSRTVLTAKIARGGRGPTRLAGAQPPLRLINRMVQRNSTVTSLNDRHTSRQGRIDRPPSNVMLNVSGTSNVDGTSMRAPNFVKWRTAQAIIEALAGFAPSKTALSFFI